MPVAHKYVHQKLHVSEIAVDPGNGNEAQAQPARAPAKRQSGCVGARFHDRILTAVCKGWDSRLDRTERLCLSLTSGTLRGRQMPAIGGVLLWLRTRDFLAFAAKMIAAILILRNARQPRRQRTSRHRGIATTAQKIRFLPLVTAGSLRQGWREHPGRCCSK